jgi:hypothetical protein
MAVPLDGKLVWALLFLVHSLWHNWSLTNFLPRLALNHNPDLHLSSIWITGVSHAPNSVCVFWGATLRIRFHQTPQRPDQRRFCPTLELCVLLPFFRFCIFIFTTDRNTARIIEVLFSTSPIQFSKGASSQGQACVLYLMCCLVFLAPVE